MQQLRDSNFKKHEEKKNEIKKQIRDSFLNNNDPQKNKMLEYKKKLEMLKNKEINLAKSPQILKNTKGKKIFFDEKLEEKDLNLFKLNFENSHVNFNSVDISELKFPDDNKNNKIKNINDFIKVAKRISKDDFNHSSTTKKTVGENVNAKDKIKI